MILAKSLCGKENYLELSGHGATEGIARGLHDLLVGEESQLTGLHTQGCLDRQYVGPW